MISIRSIAVPLMLAMVLCLFLGGCIEDFVKADVPRDIQKKLAVPAKVPLSQMQEVRDEYASAVADEAAKAARQKAEAVAAIESKAKSVANTYNAQIAALVAKQNAELQELEDAGKREAASAAAIADAADAAAKRTLSTLANSTQRAQAKADSINSLISGGLDIISPALASAFPGAGLAVTGLGLLGGLFLKKPGTDALVQKEKEDSYSKGRRDAIAAVGAGVAATDTPVVTLPKA